MNSKIDADFIKKWIKENIRTRESETLQISGEINSSDNNLYDSLSKLHDNSNLRSVGLREIVTGRSYLKKIRAILQKEVLDWTLKPYLDSQSLFNLKLIEFLDRLHKEKKSMESELGNINSKQQSMESELGGISSNFSILKKTFSSDISNTENELRDKILHLRNSSYTTDIGVDNLNYGSFEERFRGSSEDIKKRQKKYLKFLKEANDKNNDGLFIDIGSGRGEFLELLKENNLPCKGVEIDKRMIEISLKRGNGNVTEINGLDFLRQSNNDSFRGITSFQTIEHMNPEYMIHLFHQSFRTIKKGGVLIFETVNPDSLFSLMSFWKDPTHMHPIPSDVLQFYFEMAGFKNVNVIYSGDVPESDKLKGNDENTSKLNKLLFGPRDYAVVGWK